jgi:peptidoglycan/LPS O-acetylase OafA/YrhL
VANARFSGIFRDASVSGVTPLAAPPARTTPLDIVLRIRDALFGREIFRALAMPGRVPSIDLFRGVAITTVVLYHGGVLPYGYLGVDVFFVVSGLLIGRILVAKWDSEEPFRFPEFFLARGFKIWPSYYAMLFIGSLFAFFAYRTGRPNLVIAPENLARYVFFFQNYRGTPHPSFDHVWSLCVEEHFYILLPLSMIVLRRFFGRSEKALFGLVFGAILLGIAAKMLGHRLGKETYAATHNRIDALAWGVLLATLVRFRGAAIARLPRLPLFGAGVLLFAAVVGFDAFAAHRGLAISHYFHGVVLFSVGPAAVFLALLGAYHLDPSRAPAPFQALFAPLRFVAYYSYNWYLWHPVIGPALHDHLGWGLRGALLYVGITFAVGVLFTVHVEEPALALRERLLPKATSKTSKASVAASGSPTATP